jgi:hypothetical protein
MVAACAMCPLLHPSILRGPGLANKAIAVCVPGSRDLAPCVKCGGRLRLKKSNPFPEVSHGRPPRRMPRLRVREATAPDERFAHRAAFRIVPPGNVALRPLRLRVAAARRPDPSTVQADLLIARGSSAGPWLAPRVVAGRFQRFPTAWSPADRRRVPGESWANARSIDDPADDPTGARLIPGPVAVEAEWGNPGDRRTGPRQSPSGRLAGSSIRCPPLQVGSRHPMRMATQPPSPRPRWRTSAPPPPPSLGIRHARLADRVAVPAGGRSKPRSPRCQPVRARYNGTRPC